MSKEKTLEALAKIKEILREYDLWGCVGACDTERMHWLYYMEPSWSALHFNPETGEVRIRAKRADFSTKEGHHFVVQQTVGAVFNTRDYAAMLFSHMDMVAKILDQQGMEITHTPFQDIQYEKGDK